MQTVNYFIDFKSPAAYLSFHPTLALLDDYVVKLVFHPYRTGQKAVPPAHADETKGETHIRVRALAQQETHLKYAALRELPMVFPETPGNTDLALAGLLCAQQHPAAYCELAFQAYWVEGDDLNDPVAVARLLTDSGHDAAKFDFETRLQELEDLQIPSEERGVVDTPCYLIDEQVFIGREHLPWIQSLLAHSPR